MAARPWACSVLDSCGCRRREWQLAFGCSAWVGLAWFGLGRAASASEDGGALDRTAYTRGPVMSNVALSAYEDRQEWQLALGLFSIMDGASVEVSSISHNAAISAQRIDGSGNSRSACTAAWHKPKWQRISIYYNAASAAGRGVLYSRPRRLNPTRSRDCLVVECRDRGNES